MADTPDSAYFRASSAGLTLIGVIAAVTILGLLGAGVLMMMSVGTIESAEEMSRKHAFFAAESGLSAARYYMAQNAGWQENAPVTITGNVGHAVFSVVLETNQVITSVGRLHDAQWTSIWTGRVDSASGEPALSYELGENKGDLANFPGIHGDCAQSFTTPDYPITAIAIELEIRRIGQPSDIYLTLRSGSTIGPVLAASSIVTSKDMPSGNPDWVAFTLDSAVPLDPNTMYFIRLSSIPSSTDPKSKAKGSLGWVYCHSAFVPPGYAGGEAWRYIERNNVPDDKGQKLDYYDYNFRIYE